VASSWLAEGADAEVLMLFVETGRETSAAEAAALPEAAARAVLAETGLVADRVVVLAPGTLPRTSSGKLRRQETLRRHLAGELAPPAPVTPLRLAGAVARSSLAYARVLFDRIAPSRPSHHPLTPPSPRSTPGEASRGERSASARRGAPPPRRADGFPSSEPAGPAEEAEG
jgi:hypothetical protein